MVRPHKNAKHTSKRTKMDDNWSDELFSFLDEIEPLGTYATHGIVENLPILFPRITVEGIGRVAFPLMDCIVELLRGVASKAPFGRGADTLHDETVRKAWQIEASKISFGGGAAWDDFLQKLVLKVARELGISDERSESLQVKANLYKLLFYESGGHFTPHRDTEKEEGMFGTLVIQLPSRFTGGSLTVNHGSETKTFQLSEESENGYQYAAFYADCVHQLHPVTSGVRICLVYNLVTKHSKESQALSHSSINVATESKLQALVEEWIHGENSEGCLGYQLSHKYTPDSFSVAALKGRDEIVFQTLVAAKSGEGGPLFDVHLLMMERYVHSNSWECIDESISPFRVLDRNDGNVSTEEWAMRRHSDGWLRKDDENEVASDGDDSNIDAMFDEEAYRVEEGSDTGNEGASEEYWYYASAIVLEPAE